MTAPKFIALLSILLFYTPYVSGQGSVKVRGQFRPEIETTTVSVYKPVAGAFNPFYLDSKNETEIKDGRFQLTLYLDKPGFVRVQSKGMPKTYFYAEVGDDIQITFITDSAGN